MPRAAYRLQTAYRPKQTKSGVTRPFGQNHRQSISKRRARCRYGISFRQRIVRRQNQNRPASLFQQGRRFRQCRFHTVGTHGQCRLLAHIPPQYRPLPRRRIVHRQTERSRRHGMRFQQFQPQIETTRHFPVVRGINYRTAGMGGGNVPSRVAYQTRRLTQTAAPHSGQERQFPPDIGQTVGKIRTFRPLPLLGHIAHFAARNPPVGDVEVEPANNRRHSFFQKFTLCRILTKAHPPDNAEIQTHPRHFFRQRRPSANRPN